MLKSRPKPGNNSGPNCPRELKFCTRTQVWGLHNIMKRIPVFLPYFKMPPFTPMLMLKPTVLFYLKRPKPGNNSGPNCPRELKFCTRTQVWGLHNIMKRIPVFLPYFKMPPFTPNVNVKADCVILFKKTKPGNNSGPNCPRELEFCTRTQVWGLHNIMKRIPVFLPYFKMPPFTPMLMLKPTVLFYLKRPKPGNNSGPNCPRELKFCTRTQVWGLHNIMKRIPVFLPYFKMAPFTPMLMLKPTVLFYLKRPKPGNNSGPNCPRELKFCTRTQVWGLHNIMKRIPVFLPYFKMPPFTPMLMLKPTVLFYLKRPKPGNNSGPNCPRELKFCTRTQVWGLHNIMKRIPVFLPYFKMPPFTPMLMLKPTVLFYLKRPKPGNNSGPNCPRELKFCTRTQVWGLHNIMKRIPVFLPYFKMPPFTPNVNVKADCVILFKKTQARE